MKQTALFALMVVAGMTHVSAEEEHRQHHAHEHGAAKLMIAVEGDQLQIELDTPGFNLFGFEHAPQTQEEKDLVASVRAQLAQGSTLFVGLSAMSCQQTAWSMTMEDEHEDHDEDHHADHDDDEVHDTDHDEEHDHDHEESHQDWLASWQFSCSGLNKMNSLQVKLFDYLEHLEDLDVAYLLADTQGAVELSPENNWIRW